MKSIALLFSFVCILSVEKCEAWGAEGHKIVAEIAKKYLHKGVEDSVKKYLGNLSFEDAATWMDDVRSNSAYDYMKPWHFINIAYGKYYVKSEEENIMSELEKVIQKLTNKKGLTKAKIDTNLRILFHLVGDLHQPLHVGFATDMGGNTAKLTFENKESNLHRVWDSDIIKSKKITLGACLALEPEYTNSQIRKIQKIDLKEWLRDSRYCLSEVYDYKNNVITDAYVKFNSKVIEQQLYIAGLRLAAVLNKVFSV